MTGQSRLEDLRPVNIDSDNHLEVTLPPTGRKTPATNSISQQLCLRIPV